MATITDDSTNNGTVIYEETYNTSNSSFSSWIKEHIKEMMNLENTTIFDRAEILTTDNDSVFVVQFRVASRDKLDVFTSKHAAEVEAKIAKQTDLKISTRILKSNAAYKGFPQTDKFGYIF
eukprot:TRINITY_DN2732_c0_g1_i1.p1 TRINITY_DN2732_c0_g1~~TRINITY_DN2732_c0_g1_i1.p1  ORF type:complete len:121 (+),score=29.49 TRINITY_DN2732_c0_g1_i1:69-431(+)